MLQKLKLEVANVFRKRIKGWKRKANKTEINPMIEREKIIKNYIDGYNQFDIEKMIRDFDENVIFENIRNGEVDMSLSGIEAFEQQAEQAKTYFIKRSQTIKSFNHLEKESEVEIEYHAILDLDFPNGFKKGQELNLKGKSIFKFSGNRIIKLTDIS